MNTTIVDVLRHGEVEGGSKYRGWSDDPLTEGGWQQMQTSLGKENGWDITISSPLSRCALFAEKISSENKFEYVTEDNIKEIHFGDWEGKTAEYLMQTDKKRLEKFWQDPVRYSPPGGESLNEFSDRVQSAWDDLKQKQAGKRILMVTHAGVIRMLFHQIVGVPLHNIFNIEVPEACLTRFEIQYNGHVSEQILFHNSRL